MKSRLWLLPPMVILGLCHPVPATATSNNADLAALSTSAGTLSPAFDASTVGYLVTPAGSLSTATITATTAAPGATMTMTSPNSGGPEVLTSDVASNPFTLVTGDNGVHITVTAADAVTQQTYTIDIADPLSSDASLSGLTTTNGSLNQTFSSSTYTYSVVASTGTESLTATTSDPGASMTLSVDGSTPSTISSGVATSPANLTGMDTFVIQVTAPDTVTKQSYTVVAVVLPTSTSSSGAGLALPGSGATATTSGITATLNQPAGGSSAPVFVAQYPGNPTTVPTQTSASFYDVRVTGTGVGASLTVTFSAPAGTGVPTLEYFDTAANSYVPVRGSSLVSNSLVVNAAANSITVVFDASSLPAITSLNGTVFAAELAPGVPNSGAATPGADDQLLLGLVLIFLGALMSLNIRPQPRFSG